MIDVWIGGRRYDLFDIWLGALAVLVLVLATGATLDAFNVIDLDLFDLDDRGGER